MGFYFRRSLNLGPLRVNLSRGGVGVSIGGRGFRAGRSGSGRKYTNVSIPGTGVGYRTSPRNGCLLVLVVIPLALASMTVAALGALAI
jgi:hypothetical protein